MKRYLYLIILSVIAFACSTESNKQEATHESGLELANMDSTVRPRDDFFRFVNGNWINRTTIPSDKISWGSFNELFEFNNNTVLEVLKKAGENPKYSEGTDQRKAADFFSIGIDSSLAESAGLSPLRPTLSKIDARNPNYALDYVDNFFLQEHQ
jgi:putative endopeptidase